MVEKIHGVILPFQPYRPLIFTINWYKQRCFALSGRTSYPIVMKFGSRHIPFNFVGWENTDKGSVPFCGLISFDFTILLDVDEITMYLYHILCPFTYNLAVICYLIIYRAYISGVLGNSMTIYGQRTCVSVFLGGGGSYNPTMHFNEKLYRDLL